MDRSLKINWRIDHIVIWKATLTNQKKNEFGGTLSVLENFKI